jgi:hypothetical protein
MIADEKGSSVDRRMRRQVHNILRTLLILALVMAAFVAAAPWLRATIGAPMLYVVSVALMIFVLGYGGYFQFRQARGMDEVLRASQEFAVRWGAAAGQMAFILLLFLPPFQDFAIAVVNKFAGLAGAPMHGAAIIFAMFFGFGALVLLQAIGTFVFGIIWWKRSQQAR